MRRKKNHHGRNRTDTPSMGFYIDALPSPIDKVKFFRTLLKATNMDEPKLPKGWKVSWRWRNKEDEEGEFTEAVPASQASQPEELREDEFTNVINKSRGGFVTLMQRRLKRELEAAENERRNRAKGNKRKTRKPKRTIRRTKKTGRGNK